MRRMFTLVALLAVSGFPGLVYAQTATPVPAPAVNYRLTFTPTEIAVLLQANRKFRICRAFGFSTRYSEFPNLDASASFGYSRPDISIYDSDQLKAGDAENNSKSVDS
jgi:hypothetical protein